MRKVTVTGARGFIGKNLCSYLAGREDIQVISIDVDDSEKVFQEAIRDCDFIFHLAGVNRPKETNEFEIGNKGLTEKIVDILVAAGRKTPILLSSSIQAEQDNAYGRSKLGAENVIKEYSQISGADVYIFRLPNVFGKWCMPNYNSVVATWCYNTTRNLQIKINNPDTELTLVYIDDVIHNFIKALDDMDIPFNGGFFNVDTVYKKRLSEIASLLKQFLDSRKTLVMPMMHDEFTRRLYATWVSYLPEEGLQYPLTMNIDGRGWLSEFIKSDSFGQIFLSRTKPGVTRGNHWHHTKVEKFLVISGSALIRFRRYDGEESTSYSVSGESLSVVDIPVGYTHSITNVGSTDLITIFWSDEIYDNSNPDTFFLEV